MRFNSPAEGVRFSTPVNLLRDGAPLPIGTVGQPRVFAFSYPWYLHHDAQWRAAIASRPDWVMVTSWSEWYENTHIELSERNGDEYVRRAAAWVKRFRCQMNPPGTIGRSCDDEAPVPTTPRWSAFGSYVVSTFRRTA